MLARFPLSSRLFKSEASHDSARGVALILVTFVIALATIIVVSLAYNTYMATRSNLVAERSLQAEYILKSALNAARVLIKEDTAPETSLKSAWGKFVSGQNVDPEILGLHVPGLHIELEINSEEAKIPVPSLMPDSIQKGAVDMKWRFVLECLFRDLGFDNDATEVWQNPPFQNRFFTSQELVANLIDFMDPDSESYNEQDYAKGIEGEIKDKELGVFKNSRIEEIDEMSAIPGFTPARLRHALPYLTTHGAKNKININLASRRVLKCLHPGITESAVDKIIGFRQSEEGPFTKDNIASEMSSKIVDDVTWNGTSTQGGISSMVSAGPAQSESPHFAVLAKVDYGAATYFMRAYVYRWTSGELPEIYSVEIF